MADLITASDVVAFWKEAGPKRWYAKDDAFDRLFSQATHDLHWAAARRELDDWMETAEGALALMILLDQYPRNAYRGTAHQFATDALALAYARQAWDRGWPQTLDPELRQFFVTPFEHSEALTDQDAALPLAADMPEVLKYAHVHRDIIVRFGRFPHRNRVLGRRTTAEEQAFLDAGGFGG